VNSSVSQLGRPLDAQIQQAHERLGGLEVSLRAIDGELDALSTQREQYVLLEQACGSLEQLSSLGVAELFWGERAPSQETDDHVSNIRTRIDDFHQRIEEIEDRRNALIEEIKGGQDVLDILEEDLHEELELEEERQQEWLVERDIKAMYAHAQVMPWMRGGEDDSRFRRSLAATLLVSLLVGLLLPIIDLPILERAELIEVPERLARLIREEQRPLPPAQVAPEPEPETPQEELSEPEPLLADEPVPPDAVEPNDAPAPSATVEEAPEERVRSTGILAFRESFSDLAASGPAADLGAQARISTAGEAAIGRTERSMVSTDGPGSSGGINLASLSRDVGGGGGGGGDQIAGVQVSRVASAIGGNGTSDRPLSGGSASAGRTDEEIQIVFDRYKSALYRLYNRELRNNPALRGQVVLHVVIEPDGSVSLCELVSSDMNAPGLVEQVIERVKTFDFGAKAGIPAITINYPIDFLPAA